MNRLDRVQAGRLRCCWPRLISIITSEKFLQAHPDQAQAFLGRDAAGLEVRRWAHKSEAIDIVMGRRAERKPAPPPRPPCSTSSPRLITAGKNGSQGIGRIDMDVANSIPGTAHQISGAEGTGRSEQGVRYQGSWDQVPSADKSL